MANATRGMLALLVAAGLAVAPGGSAAERDWPWLGVVITDYSTDAPGSIGGRESGSYVTGVDKDGPSAVAGVLHHDIIVAIDGHGANNTRELNCLIQPRHPGEVVWVTVKRGGRPRSFSVTLGRWPEAKGFPRPQPANCDPGRTSSMRRAARTALSARLPGA